MSIFWILAAGCGFSGDTEIVQGYMADYCDGNGICFKGVEYELTYRTDNKQVTKVEVLSGEITYDNQTKTLPDDIVTSNDGLFFIEVESRDGSKKFHVFLYPTRTSLAYGDKEDTRSGTVPGSVGLGFEIHRAGECPTNIPRRVSSGELFY